MHAYPFHARKPGGGSLQDPPLPKLHLLIMGCAPKSDKICLVVAKLGPEPSKAHLREFSVVMRSTGSE